MSAVARNIRPEEELGAVGVARRPTRAGVSSAAGSPPLRRGARLTLVTEDEVDLASAESGQATDFSPIEVDSSYPARAEQRSRRGGVSASAKGQSAKAQPASSQHSAEALRLVPPAPVAVARMPFVLLTLGLIIGGIVGLLLLNTQINQDSFELQKLRDQQTQLNTREQQLSKELAVKEAPGNLAAEAARQGMVPAGAPAYITLPDGRILGVPQPARQSRR